MTDIPPATEINAALQRAVTQANRLLNSGERQACVNHCLENLDIFGEQSEFLKILGIIAFGQNDLKHAEEFYLRLTNAFADDAIGWAGLGMVYGTDNQTHKAIDALQKSVALNPETSVPYLNLGIALMKAQEFEAARDVLTSAVADFPDTAQIHLWLGHALSALDHLKEAMTHYKIVAALSPDDIDLLLPMALLERDLGNIDASTTCLEKILILQPEHPVAQFSLSQNLLMAGDLIEGFKAYECRWKREGMVRPNLKSHIWRGEPLQDKSILIYAEQGFGDAIQFIRYLSLLKNQGATLHLKAPPRLRKLLLTLGDIDKFIIEDEDDTADYNIAMMSLPHYLKTSLNAIPAEIPYLYAETSLIDKWQIKLKGLARDRKLKVGLVWQGDPGSQSEKGRSVPFNKLLPLFDLPDIQFFLIQKQDGLDQLKEINLPDCVSHLGETLDLGDDAFVDTAAVMRCLDIVISSDTSSAHLAGSLGCRTFIMLKSVPEWRWMLNRGDSPWYPTAKLFRQKTNGDWESVVQKIKQSLKKLVVI